MSEVLSWAMKQLGKLTVAQLKAELSAKGLELTGKKADLIRRLAPHVDATYDAEEKSVEKKDEGAGGEGKEADEVKETEKEGEEKEEEAMDEHEEGEAIEDQPEDGEVEEGQEEEEEEGEEHYEEEDQYDDEEHEEEEHLDEEHVEELLEEELAEEQEDGAEQDETAEYVMIDEAEGDELDDIDEDELLSEDKETKGGEMENIKVEVKNKGDDKQVKVPGRREVKVGEAKKPAVKKTVPKKEEKDGEKDEKEEKKEKKEDVKPLSEEEFKKLEDADKKLTHEIRLKNNRCYLYRAQVSRIQTMLEGKRNQLAVLVTPFRHEYLDIEVVRESMKASKECRIHSRSVPEGTEDEGGYLELLYTTNKEANEHKEKLAVALEECEVDNVDSEFLTKCNRELAKRFSGPYDFREHYRDCILAGHVQVEEVDCDLKMKPEVEDELRQYFPGARTVAVPDLVEPNDYRYLFVEYDSPVKATQALKELKDKEIPFFGENVKLSFYKAKFDEMKTEANLKATENKHKSIEKQYLKYHCHGGVYQNAYKYVKIPEVAPMDQEKRKELGAWLLSATTSQATLRNIKEPTEKDQHRMDLLNREKRRIIDELYFDDYQRKRLGLPRLQWKTAEQEGYSHFTSKSASGKPGTRGRGVLRGGYRGRGMTRGRGRGILSTPGQKRTYSQSRDGPSPRPAKQARYESPHESMERSSSYRSESRGRGVPSSYRGSRGVSRGGGYRGGVSRGGSSRGGGSTTPRGMSHEGCHRGSHGGAPRGRGSSRYPDDTRGGDSRRSGEYSTPSRSSRGAPRMVRGSGGADIRVKVNNTGGGGGGGGGYHGGSSYGGDRGGGYSQGYQGQSRNYSNSSPSYSGRGGSRGGGGGRGGGSSDRYQRDYRERSPPRGGGGGGRDQMASGHAGGRNSSGGSGRGGAPGGNNSNPVQLLLGLSKVLSNQIKQIQGDEGDGRRSGPDAGGRNYGGSERTPTRYNDQPPRGRSSGGYSGGSSYSGNNSRGGNYY